jgi:hypothetical protein
MWTYVHAEDAMENCKRKNNFNFLQRPTYIGPPIINITTILSTTKKRVSQDIKAQKGCLKLALCKVKISSKKGFS